MREYPMGFDPNQLLLPLYVPLDLTDPEELSGQRSSSLDDDEVVWSEDAIIQLHIRLLEKAIEDLKDPRVGKASKQEILDWIFVPTVPFRYAEHYPFSFQLCCQLAGLDHEELQTCINDHSNIIHST